MFAIVSMMPIASPDTAMAMANCSTLWQRGMMAKIREMSREERKRAERALSNLRNKERERDRESTFTKFVTCLYIYIYIY